MRQSGGRIDLQEFPVGDIIIVSIRICVPKVFGYAIGSINRTFLPKSYRMAKLPADDPIGKTLSVFLKTLGIGR